MSDNKILEGLITEVPALVLGGVKSIGKRTSSLGLGGRLVTALPSALAATALLAAVLPLAIVIGRIVHPILVAADSEKTKKQRIVAIALMIPKLLASIPAAAAVAVVFTVASPIFAGYMAINICRGKFGRSKENPQYVITVGED